MAGFDRLYPKKESYTMKSFMVRRLVVVSAVALVLGAAACVAPADLDVEVGRSLAIRVDVGSGEHPDPHALVEFVRGSGGHIEDVSVRVRKEGDKVTIHLDVWGDGLPEGPLADRIKAELPAFAGAEIKEEFLQGKVRGTLGKKLGHDLFDLDVVSAVDVESARQKVMEQLHAQGVEGTVDVKVEEAGGRRKVMVRVKREENGPGAGEAPEAEGAHEH